jgi:hypothetical protein
MEHKKKKINKWIMSIAHSVLNNSQIQILRLNDK